ncbi:carbon monoxide dehydrogenase [Methanomicrobiaceae archaeon CYW5]|uniref:anaerobic carbon-monoxide dehydrogenase catalytic subunit n=1 Tax=Methanovulcanius yangii TaxID=1789227 RepID=UPI0029C9BCDB|nr:anaerobic carbon-monoxide dehydrogenase catalytic subunit [Methanovulcanius yangii]MBT8507440.1 carbon monoxide dehydrogenase [Methanovulcanius yangii]
MEDDRISYHASVRAMYEKLRADGMSNVWDRYEAQGFGGDPDKRCGFCMAGARCDFCSNGPCRVNAEEDKRGVCGISADGIAMRMMLLRNLMGASTYHYHADKTVRTLRQTALGKTPFSIREPEKLITFAERLGITPGDTIEETALRVCDVVEKDFISPVEHESTVVAALAPWERQEVWKNLGIFPGGIHAEIMNATGSCLTNVDGYYVSLALKAMRLSIAMAYQSQLVLEHLQDVLYGIPRPHEVRVDLGVLDPDYVNVLPNGHEPFLGFALIDVAREEKWQEKARSAGAKGLRIIGNIETGQEMIQRWENDEVFYGYTGNWIMQEAILATGAVDVFVADMNCSLPLDPVYADKYKFVLLPVSDLVAFEGADTRLNYAPREAEQQAEAILAMAIDNYPRRRAAVTPVTGFPVGTAIAGFSPESITEALGGSLTPLLDAVKEGTIRGIVGLVSCTTLRDSGQDVKTVALAKELVHRDILVLSMGCGSAALQVAGLCSPEAKEFAGKGLGGLCEALGIPPVLSFGTCTDTGRCADLLYAVSEALGGVPVADLPVAAAAPEYMEQKATIDAIFALAFGLYTYVNPVPTVTGGPNLVRLLTSELPDITGGVLHLEEDTQAAANGIADHIESKRTKLGL